MDILLGIIKRKPTVFLISAIFYLLALGFLKWQLQPPLLASAFIGGGIIGIYLLDITEAFMRLTPSPFRTILFLSAFGMVSLFVITSSGSLLASGLVLSLFLSLLLWQVGELQVRGNLNDWYRLVAVSVSPVMQRWVLVGFFLLFLLESYLFIRS